MLKEDCKNCKYLSNDKIYCSLYESNIINLRECKGIILKKHKIHKGDL